MKIWKLKHRITDEIKSLHCTREDAMRAKFRLPDEKAYTYERMDIPAKHAELVAWLDDKLKRKELKL